MNLTKKLSSLVFISMLFASSLAPAQYTAPAVQNPDGSVTVTISAEQMEICRAEGGCGVVSVEWVAQTIAKACGKEI